MTRLEAAKPPSRRLMLPCALAALALWASPAAQAQSCTTSAVAPTFGVYNAAGNNTLANGIVNVSCNVLGIPLSITYTIRLGLGSQPAGTQRQLAGGPGDTGRLPYNLFCDPAYTQVWADGSGQTCVISGGHLLLLGGILTPYPVYGRINGGHYVPAGSYSDMVTVEVLY